jgi:enoyl-CoA hydratase/carnithine racemase
MTPQDWKFIMRRCAEMVTTMLDTPVPVIAAVNGPARVRSDMALLKEL